MILESLNESYPMLLATCLYLNKLDLVIRSQHIFERMNPRHIEQLMYASISKDKIEELIENNEIIEPIIQ